MVPEYKFYHGAALCELIDVCPFDIKIGELKEDGRLTSYVIDKKIRHPGKALIGATTAVELYIYQRKLG